MSDMINKKALIPSRGIGAGSADSTFELACFMVRPLRQVRKTTEGKDGGERQAEVPSKVVRRRITKKINAADNEQRQEANRS